MPIKAFNSNEAKQQHNWQYYQFYFKHSKSFIKRSQKEIEITNYAVPLSISVKNC